MRTMSDGGLAIALSSPVGLLMEQRFSPLGNSFLNLVDSEDLRPLVRRSGSCPPQLAQACDDEQQQGLCGERASAVTFKQGASDLKSFCEGCGALDDAGMEVCNMASFSTRCSDTPSFSSEGSGSCFDEFDVLMPHAQDEDLSLLSCRDLQAADQCCFEAAAVGLRLPAVQQAMALGDHATPHDALDTSFTAAGSDTSRAVAAGVPTDTLVLPPVARGPVQQGPGARCAAVRTMPEISQDVDATGIVAQGHFSGPEMVIPPSPTASESTELEPKAKISDVYTLMVQNLPRNMTQKDLLHALNNQGMQGQYDFLYLPASFTTGSAQGYAFVNFTSTEAAQEVLLSWNRRKPWGRDMEKGLHVIPAAIQGLEANIARWDTAKMRRVRNPDHRALVLRRPGQPLESLPTKTKKGCSCRR